MCDSISSAISRLSVSPRKTLATLDQSDISDRPQHLIDGGGSRQPARFFDPQLLLSGGRQLIDAGPPPGLLLDPFRANPPSFFHAIEGRVERTFLNPQQLVGTILNSGHDAVPMRLRQARKDLQHQQVKGSLEGIRLFHTKMTIYRRLYVMSRTLSAASVLLCIRARL